MIHNSHKIASILLDIDAILLYFGSYLYKKNNNIRGFISLKKDFILYPPFIDDKIWVSNVVIKLNNFLSYLFALNLSIGIISSGNLAFIHRLIGVCNLSNIDFKLVVSEFNCLNFVLCNEIIALVRKKLIIRSEKLVVIGSNVFDFNFSIFDKKICLCFIDFLSFNFFKNKKKDLVFASNLEDVLTFVYKGTFFNTGKLPNKFLNKLLLNNHFKDSSVIVGPSIGEDTAVISIQGCEMLVLKTDPITYLTNNIGYYSVLINANDMVTSGTMPRWMLTTLIFPPSISAYVIKNVFEELYTVCLDFNLSLCGGHTEITDAVSRPVVVSTAIGTIKHKDLITKTNIKPGNAIIMTKGAGIEGTVIIASEFKELLIKKGMTPIEIEECLDLRKQISVLKEAKIAWKNMGVTALHDVTEGGVITALSEINEVSGYGVKVNIDNIFIYPQTRRICNLLNIDPMGLIGSGSLLICCKQSNLKYLLEKINNSGIYVKVIGKVINKNLGVETFKLGKRVITPKFISDEITCMFE